MLALLAVLGGWLPACQPVNLEADRTLDDALLLALASHEQLDIGRPTTDARGAGHRMSLAAAAARGGRNPHWEMARWYEDMAAELEGHGDPMFDYAVEKIEEHNRLAVELDRARERRASRGRGFQRFVRGVARVPGNIVRAVGIGVQGTLRLAKSVVVLAAEEVPSLARQYIERKIRETGALLQGRIDLVWDKVAERVGLPFASWLRQRVDRAFVRHRDRFLARIQGKPRQQQAGASAELGRQVDAFGEAGLMVVSCAYREFTDPVYAGTGLTSIPFEIRLDLENETFTYQLEAEAYYEDYQKCDVTVTVDGAGVLAGDDGWFQGEEMTASVTSCYLLNVQTGEKHFAEPREGGWTREIAGFVVPSPWTLYWCPVGPLGDVNTMMQAGKEALIASGHCQACPVETPR